MVPVVDSRGLITYRYETDDPGADAPPPPVSVSQEAPTIDAAERQAMLEARYDRDMAEWRKNHEEQVRRDRQEEQAQQDASRNLRRVLAAQERQSLRSYLDQEANRRDAMQRELLERHQAESLRYQQESSGALRLLQDQQKVQQALSRPYIYSAGGGIDNRFPPATAP